MILANTSMTNGRPCFVLAIGVESIDGDVMREHQKQEQGNPFLHTLYFCKKINVVQEYLVCGEECESITSLYKTS